jgi:hypothetical protein
MVAARGCCRRQLLERTGVAASEPSTFLVLPVLELGCVREMEAVEEGAPIEGHGAL